MSMIMLKRLIMLKAAIFGSAHRHSNRTKTLTLFDSLFHGKYKR